MKTLGIILTILIMSLLIAPYIYVITVYNVFPSILEIIVMVQIFAFSTCAGDMFYRWFLSNIK